MLTARELFDRGVEHGNAGRHARAERCLAEAARRTDDPDLAARIEGTRAYVLAETGDPEQALARCRAALAGTALSLHTRAVLVSQIGLVELRRGHLEPALTHLSAAADALTDDPGRLGRVLLNRGLAHLDRGDVALAEQDFTQAAARFAHSGEPVEQAKAQHNQGYAALVRGDLVAALRLMEQARTVLVALSPVALAVCDTDRAAVLCAAGQHAEAVALLTQVVEVFRRRRLRQAQADAELALADALLGVDPHGAAVVAQRAARRLRARGNEVGALRADAFTVAGQVLVLPDAGAVADVPTGARPAGSQAASTRAAATARRAAATADGLTAHGLPVEAAAVRLHTARLAARTGRTDAARTLLAHVQVPQGASIPVRLLAAEVRTEVAAAAGRPDQVLADAAAGLDELERWQSTFGSLDLQAGAAVRGRTLLLHGLRAALADGDPRCVFEWSERARGLASRVVPLRPPPDPRTAADLTELRRLRLLGGGPGDAHREAELRDAVRRRAWAQDGAAGHDTGRGAGVADLAAVRAELDASGADLVAHVWAGDRIAALVVTDDARVVDLGAWAPVATLLDGLLPDLDLAAADLPAPIAAVVRASLDERLTQLDTLLVAPVRHLLRHDRVVLTPAGSLSRVPWEMLASLAEVTTTRPTSAGRWVEQRRAAPDPWDAVGAAGFAAGPGVARATDEVRAAATSWADAQVLAGDAATTGGVAGLARGVDVLHVAAHGRHSATHPLFSAFELVDGPWFGYDIDTLDRVPQVVVLSACELGRSAAGWGREALGMAQAWLHAGARCVVAAGANVNDDVACEVLGTVHRALAAGVPPSQALHDASAAAGARTSFAVHGAGW